MRWLRLLGLVFGLAQLAACGSRQRPAANCAPPEAPPPGICGPNRCGNAALDSCTICTAGPLCPMCAPGAQAMSDPGCTSGWSYTASELCDGAALGAATCSSLGFSGGTLACNDFCTYDTNGCTTCQPGPQMIACRHTELAADLPHALAIAATDDEVLVAWVPGPGTHGAPPAAGGVQLARFDRDLSLVSQSGCFGPPHAYAVAIARSRTGYVIAIEADGQVVIQPLDATGAVSGPSRAVDGALRPALFPRQAGGTISGGPLLVWAAPPAGTPNPPTIELRAQLLADDGSAQAEPVTVFAAANPLPYTSAVFTGSGFVVAAASFPSGAIAFVGSDGSVTLPPTPALAQGAHAGLAWNGSAGGVVYSPLDQVASPGSWWVPMDAAGNATAAPMALDAPVYLPPPVLGLESGVVIVRSADPTIYVDFAGRLDVVRISLAGAIQTGPFQAVVDPEGLTTPRVARMGGEAVLAWVGAVNGYPGRIGLARIAP